MGNRRPVLHAAGCPQRACAACRRPRRGSPCTIRPGNAGLKAAGRRRGPWLRQPRPFGRCRLVGPVQVCVRDDLVRRCPHAFIGRWADDDKSADPEVRQHSLETGRRCCRSAARRHLESVRRRFASGHFPTQAARWSAEPKPSRRVPAAFAIRAPTFLTTRRHAHCPGHDERLEIAPARQAVAHSSLVRPVRWTGSVKVPMPMWQPFAPKGLPQLGKALDRRCVVGHRDSQCPFFQSQSLPT